MFRCDVPQTLLAQETRCALLCGSILLCMVAELLVELAAWAAGASEALGFTSVLGVVSTGSVGLLWLRGRVLARRSQAAPEEQAVRRWRRIIIKLQRIRFRRSLWAFLGHHLNERRRWPRLGLTSTR